MSHNIMHSTYPLNVSRNTVQREWDNYVRHADYGEGASGLPNPIRWIEIGISETYEEAEKRIEKMDDGWYDQIAVKYKHYTKMTKTYEIMKNHLIELEKSLREKNTKIHYANVTSKFLGCKNCGSKIATEYIKSNCCPVCHTDLRPASVLKNIENAKKKIETLKSQLAEEEKKAKYEVRWLVKIEYHT